MPQNLTGKILYLTSKQLLPYPFITQEALKNLLGGKLPPAPEMVQIPLEKALQFKLQSRVKKDGQWATNPDGSFVTVPFQTRYQFTRDSIILATHNRAQVVVNCERVGKTLYAQFDDIVWDDGALDIETDRSVPNGMMVPLELRDGEFFVHMQLEYRKWGWSLGFPGGFSTQGLTAEQSMMLELEEEWGKGKIKHLKISTDEELGYANRTGSRTGTKLGFFVFNGSTYVPSNDPKGFEVVNKLRIALPARVNIGLPDFIVSAAWNYARSHILRDLVRG